MNPDEIRLLDPHFYAGDPWPTYRWLRENSPVHWDARHGVWGISRFADVVAIEKDPELYTSSQGSRPRTASDTSMINADDPHHNGRRRLVSSRFTPRAVRRHEKRIRGIVTELIDAVIGRGECEVVESLASPLPAKIINEWLGFPPHMWEKCRWWSEITMYAGGQHTSDGSMDFGAVPQAMEAVGEFAQEVLALAALRRKEPKDDLVSIWANAEHDGRKLTDEDVVAEALLVLDGGAETTRSVIGTTVVHLIRHPARVIASYAAKREAPSAEDIGFAQQLALYERVGGVVIDSHDIRDDPETMLNRLCGAIGLPFSPAMLRWPAGGRPEDGIWARHWYGAVHRSRGFAGPEGPLPRLSGDYAGLCQAVMPPYEAMRIRALKPH